MANNFETPDFLAISQKIIAELPGEVADIAKGFFCPRQKTSFHIDISGIETDNNLARKLNGELKQGENLSFIVLERNSKFIIVYRLDPFEIIEEKVKFINAKERQ